MAILFIILGFFSGWGMIHGMCVLFGGYQSSGTVWGCHYKGKGNRNNIIYCVGGFLLLVVTLVVGLMDLDVFADCVSYWTIAILAGIAFSIYTLIRVRNKCYAGNNILSAIAHLPFMADLDRYAAQCQRFELYSNGISFYNEANYCIGQIIFTDYQLGDIPGSEIFAAYYGLVQKFRGVFTNQATDHTVGRDKRTDTVITERLYIFRRKK